ncbi:ricin-type beta-trefoil lectin domain protein [Streptomyces sp. NPDC020801]|uniref:ricin-type beta-trefoil lectin domain protein n=1 Tax=Streptomyces sp. NPDC020801 TaxID=3365093 RepID=UPI00378900FE
MKIASDDGTGQYMQVLRTLDLYVANSSSSSSYPGSQAGVADLFSSVGDYHQWDPSVFWHWNLRMQTAANQSSGTSQLNNPFFNLYLSNLKNMQTWTTVNMHVAGLLIGDGSQDCLDVVGGSHSAGTSVDIWGCSRGAANQTWAWNPTTDQYTVYQGQSYAMCLDTSGSNVVVNTCSTAQSQQWTPQANGGITNKAGQCLDVTGGSTSQGSLVGVYTCGSPLGSNQIWRNPDICVPEAMRFNGNGYQNGSAASCVNTDKSGPTYNARTLSTGAEVGLEVWNQYLDSGDTTFLNTYYPLMKDAAEFLLDYSTTGADGKLHTYPSNAHETQWDVHDPATDIAAMTALFPAVKSAAQTLNVDTSLQAELTTAIGKLRDFQTTALSTLVGTSSDMCLGVPSGANSAGTTVAIYPCADWRAYQSWVYNATSKQYTIYAGQNYALCLDTSGNNVVANTCSSTATTQQWTPHTSGASTGEITNSAGQCLDVTGNAVASGSPVGVYTCGSPPGGNQTWISSPVIAMSNDVPSELSDKASGQCLDVAGDSHNAGTSVDIWPCSAGPENQSWVYNATSKQYTVYAGQSYALCLDTSGSNVVVNTCSSTATTQQWTPQTSGASTGEITNSAGQCLDVSGGSTSQGSLVVVDQCSSPPGSSQIWKNGTGTTNNQNIGLEPVWPYSLIGDDTSLTNEGISTFMARPNPVDDGGDYDWNVEPIQAARLGLSSLFASTLKQSVVNNQVYQNGFGYYVATTSPPAAPSEFLGEQQGVVATALNEALAQDYDGELRIAPSVPATWDVDGTVAVQGGTRVSVQIHHGSIEPVGITAGPGVNPSSGTYTITVRNPWPGQSVQVVDGSNTSNVVVSPTTSSEINITATSGHTYVVEQVSAPITGMTYQQVTGTPASQPITLTGNIGTTSVTRKVGF